MTPGTEELLASIVVVVVLMAWYLTYTAARLHRLHTRVEGALAALDAQLVRRADAAVELANCGALDPATALIVADAAADCLDAAADVLTGLDWVDSGLAEREDTESTLTRVLALAAATGCPSTDEPDAERTGLDSRPATTGAPQIPRRPEFARVQDAAVRVHLARRFYNDAVVDVRRLRAEPFVRFFRLAGHAQLPRTVEFDDAPPVGGGSARWASEPGVRKA